MPLISVTLDISKFDIDPLNKLASLNMYCISVTLEVLKFDKFLLNDFAPLTL